MGFLFHVSPYHKEEVTMKRAIIGLIFAVALVSVLSYQAQSAERMVLGEYFTNTS